MEKILKIAVFLIAIVVVLVGFFSFYAWREMGNLRQRKN